jgi:peptidoglycan hydrolase-like protein with peptidoglycan-binding domain
MSGAAALLEVARSQLGYTEQPAGSNRTKFGEWYGMDGSAWCAMFVSWCAANSDNASVIPRFAYTPAGAEWFKSRASFGSRPVVGAIAFYDTAGLGRISHTGIVESVAGDGRWYAIEGNTDVAGGRTGGSVRRQLRSTVGTSRGGFGLPAYTAAAAAAGLAYPGLVLRRGAIGGAVRAVQTALNRSLAAAGHTPLTIDGSFGPATLTAVLWFQGQHAGLSVDGLIGPATWAALAP